jgi:hypothetical protein
LDEALRHEQKEIAELLAGQGGRKRSSVRGAAAASPETKAA